MVSKITVSILALIGWNLVEWTGDEGKLLKLGELCAIKHSVLRSPPLWEKKSDASFLWSSLWEGKGSNASFRLLWRVEWCQKDLVWHHYDQSKPRLTSAGSAMATVSLERVQLGLVPIPLKWNQRYRDGAYLFVVCLCPFQHFVGTSAYRGRLL